MGRCAELPLVCAPCLPVVLLVCVLVGLYAGHPYIHLISFEIFLLACDKWFDQEEEYMQERRAILSGLTTS